MSPEVTGGRGNYQSERLAGYVEVRDRIRLFYERYPDGRLVTTSVTVSSEPDGKPRVTVEAAAYRTTDDPLPGRGNSWMELPGSTPYTRGSELENTETSAWGRAIGAVGIGIDKSIASAQEVRNKEGEADRPVTPPPDPFDAGLIGTAKASGNDDFELRQTPTGSALPFRLAEGRTSWKVLATGVLADLINEYREGIKDQLVTCWGTLEDKSFPKGERTIHYKVLNLSRLKVGVLDLTAPDVDEEPVADEDFEAGFFKEPAGVVP